MAMTKKEIQDRSDKKRGVRMVGFKLKEDIIQQLNALSERTGKSKTALIEEMILNYQG
ncbi:ribbon-helix-helix protein, CopG family [Haemophilus influenzae]|uniref:ribbon-helix-helix protein, CopG family n=1 Tax=Haemophilus influenzae TaxID=727 RepID=UPI0002EAF844|nr:ribbon-helix-helix protein, CopG family [Haemophilus influenzae]QEQ61200.1 ribbon-helix-helix protein, CopG family [Haemophilus influenzae biotype aegyptius]QEQ63306.1 ribbon-helix-helix protein, CopG family [Haemophilus influenzae biotype aegyptius]QEQ64760.1 ribbon-helix-helix protein, CopG family [Haemophilus influenzae biotype aegyptius]